MSLRFSMPAAVVLTLALTGAALAAGEADGGWDCTLPSGAAMGSVGFDGNAYVYANPQGESGRGALAYQDGADAPTLVVLNGPLVFRGMLGGWLDASIPSEPSLMLIDAVGNKVSCVPR